MPLMVVSTISGVSPNGVLPVPTSPSGKRRDADGVTSASNDTEVDVDQDFASRFIVLINIVRAGGGLPVYKTISGWRFSFKSRLFVYSVFVYLTLFVLCLHVIDVLLDRNAEFSGSRHDFHRRVFNHMFIGLLSMYLLVPVSAWMDAPSLAAYFNEWNAFQVMFRCTVGFRLRVKDTRRTQLTVAVGFTAFVTVGLLIFGPQTLCTWQLLPHAVAIMFTVMSGCYWMLTCRAIIDAVTQLQTRFSEAMRTTDLPRHQLHAYRHLWMALSRLAGNTSGSLARTAGVFTLAELYLIVLAVHGLITSLIGSQQSIELIILYIMATYFSVLAFYFFCNMGYHVTRQVQNSILEELQTLNTTAFDCKTVRELSLFFQCVAANPPILCLGGFVTVNRGLFKSAFATILTYLVVIIQFELSLDVSDGTSAQTNDTRVESASISE